MTDSRISAAMQAAVGTELTRQVSHPVSVSDIRRWALAVYWPEPAPQLFVSEEYARGTVHQGIVAPEEFNPFAWSCAETWARDTEVVSVPNDPDHMENQAGVPGPGLEFQLNGGMAVEYGDRMRPGHVITSSLCLGPYSEREGRLGLMLFSTLEETWTNQSGRPVKRTVSTLIRY
jgi:hypothetical protein